MKGFINGYRPFIVIEIIKSDVYNSCFDIFLRYDPNFNSKDHLLRKLYMFENLEYKVCE